MGDARYLLQVRPHRHHLSPTAYLYLTLLYSTLLPSCLPSSSPTGAEAVSFFQTVVSLFKTLPTYDWLSAAHITPNEQREYTFSEIKEALTSAAGVVPQLTCEDKGKRLNSVSWYFNLKGSMLDGQFVPVGEYCLCLIWG